MIKRVLLICYIRKFCLLDDVLGFYMTKLRYTHLSLTIVHLLDLHLMLLTHLPSNKLAKFLVPISSPLTINEHTAKDCCVWHLLKKLLRLIVNMSWLVQMLKAFLPIYLQRKRLKTLLMICFLINLKLIIWLNRIYDLLSTAAKELFFIFDKSLSSNRWSSHGVPFRPNPGKCFFSL